MYRPIDRSLQMNTPANYYPCTTLKVNGREKKEYSPNGVLIMGHYKENGGSETVINGVKLISKSITFTCWYDPRVEQKGRFDIYGKTYEIINVEDVEMRHRYMVCELERVEAGA